MTIGGAIAAGHDETASVAADVLADGGNAFDAALAAMCAACIAEPALASPGGGGFLLALPADGPPVVYDFFPQTPRRFRSEDDCDFFPIVADFGAVQQEFHIGMGSIATPGFVRGLFDAHADLGRMPMRRLVEPATALARAGTRISPMQAFVLGVIGPIFKSNAASMAVFGSRDRPDELIGDDEVLRMPEMADALEVMAIEGADLFYRGEIASIIVDHCATHGGHLAADDLRHYTVERRHPLTVDLPSARLHVNPPPSLGGILIAFALEMLREIDVAGLGFGTDAYLKRLARVMEVTNHARAESGLQDEEPAGAAHALFDPALIAAYRAAVQDHPTVTRGTTHISVIDATGNAAALSLSNGEGSGYIVPGAGFMLNNMLGEEDINPCGFHRWLADTRMSSMMAPMVVTEAYGTVAALGSGGSNRIRTAILQVVLNLLMFRAPLAEAVARPRIHFENRHLDVEPGFDDAAIDALAEAFPDIKRWDALNMFFGGVHAARRAPGGNGFDAAGDPRRDGVGRVI